MIISYRKQANIFLYYIGVELFIRNAEIIRIFTANIKKSEKFETMSNDNLFKFIVFFSSK